MDRNVYECALARPAAVLQKVINGEINVKTFVEPPKPPSKPRADNYPWALIKYQSILAESFVKTACEAYIAKPSGTVAAFRLKILDTINNGRVASNRNMTDPPELEMGPLKSKMKTLGYPSRALKRKAAEAGLDDDGDGASPATAVPVVESPGTPVTPVNTPPAPV